MSANVTKKIIIGLIVLALVGGPAIPFAKNDETPTPIPSIVQTCQDQFPRFKEENPFDKFNEDAVDTTEKFKRIFMDAQDYYHGYISCIFDAATQEIIGNDGASNDSGRACLDANKLKDAADKTSSAALLPYTLQAYTTYSHYLESLQSTYRSDIFLSSVTDGAIIARRAELAVVNESENALTALSVTFSQLSELRQAFVLHVQFQCMLKNLEEYRTFLGKLRTIVLLLPARIIDASQTR
ncbi:MAG: hypothetical protein V1908_00425 [Candidatus Peregrinibacteria bacterium]